MQGRAPWLAAVVALFAALAALAGLVDRAPGGRTAPGASPSPPYREPLLTPGELTEVLPADSIPSIDDPTFISPGEAGWLAPAEPVVSLELAGDARAYPAQIMTWHEIVNDVVAGQPVAVTYCPLCNSAVAFRRAAGGRVLELGTSGMLYNSALVMYDRQTGSLWLHYEGLAVRGPLTGERLEIVPVQMLSFGDWRREHPDGRVLSRETGASREYGVNPYDDYDSSESPFLFEGPLLDDRLPAMARVVGVAVGDAAVAYPHEALARESGTGVIRDRLGGTDLVVLWKAGTASALDARKIAHGRDVGASGVFVPEADGRRLTLAARGRRIVDLETGSTWSVSGAARSGPLAGARLGLLPHVDTFWFAWQAYHEGTRLYGA